MAISTEREKPLRKVRDYLVKALDLLAEFNPHPNDVRGQELKQTIKTRLADQARYISAYLGE